MSEFINRTNDVSRGLKEDVYASSIGKMLNEADLTPDQIERVAKQGVFYALMRRAQAKRIKEAAA